jgi:hypothetical protein
LLSVAIASASQAAVSIYVSPESLAERSPWIVEGTVESSRSGYDPLRATLATYVTLDVEVVHRGPQHVEQVVIREHGGRYGSLVHETDAVPVYEAGERVFVFLEPDTDGALRTSGMFFGKFSIEADSDLREPWAVRELDGQGTILHRPATAEEGVPLADLAALTASVPLRRPRTASPHREMAPPQALSAMEVAVHATPPEYGRLLWDEDVPDAGGLRPAWSPTNASLLDPMAVPGPPTIGPNFRPLSSFYPSRWPGTDNGEIILVDIERDRDPLGDGEAAVAEVLRAMQTTPGRTRTARPTCTPASISSCSGILTTTSAIRRIAPASWPSVGTGGPRRRHPP